MNIKPNHIVKYLKSLALVEASSDHTLVAYASDLEQFLGPIWNLNIEVKSTGDLPGISISGPSGAPEMVDVRPLGQADLLDLYQKSQHLWADLAPSTKNRKFSSLRSFFRWLASENLIEANLAEKIHVPKVPKKLPNFLSVDEALHLIEQLNLAVENSEKNAERDRLLILLLYGGGLRVSEACEMRSRNVELQQQRIRIKGKGGKERLVVLPETVVKVLSQVNLKNQEYVFGEKPLSPQVAYNIVRGWGAKTGLLRRLSPHALRHSFATHMLSSGANLRSLQELLGHTSLAATEKYTHISTDGLARTMNSHHPLGDSKD